MARSERGGDREERVGQRAGDVVAVEVAGAVLQVVGMLLEVGVILLGDAVTEDP